MSEEGEIVLKDCPFCGGAGTLHYEAGNENWPQSWQCSCTKCLAKTERAWGSSTWAPKPATDDKARRKAVEAWNMRSPSQG